MFSLIHMARGAITRQFIDQTAAALGESPERTRRGLDLVVSSLLAGFVHKGSTAVGADELFAYVRDFGPHGPAGHVSPPPASGEAVLDAAPGRGGLLSSLFGGKAHVLAEGIARSAGLRVSSAAALLETALPVVTGVVGGEVSRLGLDASGLMLLLDEQRGSIARAVPAELEVFFSGRRAEVPPRGARPGEAGTWDDLPLSPVTGHEPAHDTAARGVVWLQREARRRRWTRIVPVLLGVLMLGTLAWLSATQRHDTQPAVGGAGAAGAEETYRCVDGQRVTVEQLNDEQVRVAWGERPQVLSRPVGSTATRFSNERFTWHMRGDEGVLSSGDVVLHRCRLAP